MTEPEDLEEDLFADLCVIHPRPALLVPGPAIVSLHTDFFP